MKIYIHSKRLFVLDALRGLAAVLVLFHHLFKLNLQFFKTNFSSALYSFFYFISDLNLEAVIFFFILSGFSIGLSLKNKSLLNSDHLNTYFYRRFKRILPIYWIALLLTIVCGMAMKQISLPEYNLVNLAGNLFFLQTIKDATDAWIIPYGFNGPFWSLSYEFFFYCFFPIAYIVNARLLFKLNTSIKFVVLLLLTMVAMTLNKLVFIPYVAFFTSFIIWLLGYMCSGLFLYGTRKDLLFIGAFLIGTAFLSFGYIYIPSNTLMVICKGLIMASVFYFFTRYHTNVYMLAITHWPVKIINKLFLHIGKGSYALYALHYPILLLMDYYGLPMYMQLGILVLLIVICTPLEEWTITLKLSVFKRNYSTNMLNKLKTNTISSQDH